MKLFPISANSIKTFQQCKYKFKLQYYDKKPRRKAGPPLVLGSAVHAALEKLYSFKKRGSELTEEEKDDVISEFYTVAVAGQLSNWMLQDGLNMVRSRIQAFDPDEKVLGIELAFGGRRSNKSITTPNGTPLSGYIDKLVEINPTTLVVVDYKTSRIALTQREAEDDVQLSMYDYAVRQMFPQYENVILVLDYLRYGEVVSYRTDKDMKPELNEYCNYCDFKDYCSKYKETLTDEDLVLPPLAELSDEDLAEHWQAVKAKKKLVVSREREIDMEVTDRIRRQGPLFGKNGSIHIQQRSRTTYDSKAIVNIVPADELASVVNVNKKAIDNYLQNNPDKEDEINDAASVAFSAPFLQLRKSK